VVNPTNNISQGHKYLALGNKNCGKKRDNLRTL
jgi:hypothetical protein